MLILTIYRYKAATGDRSLLKVCVCVCVLTKRQLGGSRSFPKRVIMLLCQLGRQCVSFHC